jgi:hypothetical protein
MSNGQRKFPQMSTVDRLPLPRVIVASKAGGRHCSELEIAMIAAEATVSSTFSNKTPVWTYAGSAD